MTFWSTDPYPSHLPSPPSWFFDALLYPDPLPATPRRFPSLPPYDPSWFDAYPTPPPAPRGLDASLRYDPNGDNYPLRCRLWVEQGGYCNGYGRPPHPIPLSDAQIDHMWPRFFGGPNYIGNLQVLCSSCNPAKGIFRS